MTQVTKAPNPPWSRNRPRPLLAKADWFVNC